MALDVLPAKHVDVADNVFTPAKLVIDLRTERTIKTVGIYLFIFEKLACVDPCLEVFRRQEEVLHPVTLRATRRAARSADREVKVQFGMLHKFADNGALPATTWCREDNDFPVVHSYI